MLKFLNIIIKLFLLRPEHKEETDILSGWCSTVYRNGLKEVKLLLLYLSQVDFLHVRNTYHAHKVKKIVLKTV